jgi:hypothetical protein
VADIIKIVRDGVFADPFIAVIGSLFGFHDRLVTREEAEEKARGSGIPSFEMDAETGEGSEDGFDPPDSKNPANKEWKASAQ